MGKGQTPVSAPLSSEGREVGSLGWRALDARNPQLVTARHSKQHDKDVHSHTFVQHSIRSQNSLSGITLPPRAAIGGDTFGGVKKERSPSSLWGPILVSHLISLCFLSISQAQSPLALILPQQHQDLRSELGNRAGAVCPTAVSGKHPRLTSYSSPLLFYPLTAILGSFFLTSQAFPTHPHLKCPLATPAALLGPLLSFLVPPGWSMGRESNSQASSLDWSEWDFQSAVSLIWHKLSLPLSHPPFWTPSTSQCDCVWE